MPLICNEDGKLLGLPLNGTLFKANTGKGYDIIDGMFFLYSVPANVEAFTFQAEEQLKSIQAPLCKTRNIFEA